MCTGVDNRCIIVSIARILYMTNNHKTGINLKNVELRIFPSTQVNNVLFSKSCKSIHYS